MLRTILTIGAVWFAVAAVLGLFLGRYLRRQREAEDAAREQPRRFRNSA
jgi:hypothetical protein